MLESRVRVLIVNPKLNLAVGVKTALEALDGFEARAFTSALNALEFARTMPPDAAVLDLAIRSPNLGEASIALRKLNPKIKLILTNAPDEAITRLRADGQIVLPARAREIEPLLRRLFPPTVSDNRPPTPVRRPIDLRKLAEGKAAFDPSLPDPFDQLAKDEPPVPTGTEGGTIREAVRALLPRQPLDESMYVVEITPRPSDTDEGQPLVIEAGAEDKTEDPTEAGIAAPPVAITENGTQPNAPVMDFHGAPFDDSDADLDDSDPEDEHSQPEAPVESPPVMLIEEEEPARPADMAPPIADAPEITPQPAAPEIKIPGQRRPVKKKTGNEIAPSAGKPQHAVNPAPDDIKHALKMTYEQIGSTAAALILTDGGDVIAHSGEMPTQEINELRAVIGGDWAVSGNQARIRYITLPTSREEYILHTRRTENGYTLSMAFAGDRAVSEIRAQSDSVAATLESYRNDQSSLAPMPPDLTARLPFTAVWMLDNPDDPLTADIAQAVVLEFDSQLHALGWPIHAMNVHADFVYVYCDVQTTYLASEVVADLKRISAEAACARRPDWSPDTLWADAYMALLPGRELGSDEVQSFLAFTRARLSRKTE